jgi:hypothetical protein
MSQFETHVVEKWKSGKIADNSTARQWAQQELIVILVRLIQDACAGSHIHMQKSIAHMTSTIPHIAIGRQMKQKYGAIIMLSFRRCLQSLRMSHRDKDCSSRDPTYSGTESNGRCSWLLVFTPSLGGCLAYSIVHV